jgi:tetratricopeptide (TPR) repeat protein
LRSSDLPYGRRLQALWDLANTYEWLYEWQIALPLNEEAWLISKGHQGEFHVHTVRAMEIVALDLRECGDLSRAIELQRAALTHRRATEKPSSGYTKNTEVQLGISLQTAGQNEEAKQLLEGVLAKVSKFRVNDAFILKWLASAMSGLDDDVGAIRPMEQAFTVLKDSLGLGNPRTRSALHDLAITYWNGGSREAALGHLQKYVTLSEEVNGVEDPETVEARDLLARLRQEMQSDSS